MQDEMNTMPGADDEVTTPNVDAAADEAVTPADEGVETDESAEESSME